MLIASRITCIQEHKTLYEVVHQKKLNLHETYEWGRDIYVEITQGDKLQPQAKLAKWIGHSGQSCCDNC